VTWAAALPWLVALPFAAAALVPAVAVRRPGRAAPFAIGVVAACAVLAGGATLQLVRAGPFAHAVGGFAAPLGIELRFDAFSAWVLPLMGLLLLILPYARTYLQDTLPDERRAPFYALVLANAGGMAGFALSGDLFNLFVFMEVVALSAYALVAVGGGGLAAWAALKYLLIGAVSSLLMLLGVGMLFALTGSLDLHDVAVRLGGVPGFPVSVALGLLATSFLVKAALFPLHVWLPDAHAIAPSPVSAVLSGLVVKIGILGLLRLVQLGMTAEGVDLSGFHLVLTVLGSISILMGAFLAMFQDDIKLMLAYSTISNVGYIVLGLGLATPFAMIGGAVHVFNHALIKTALFLAAGTLIHATGLRTLGDLRGVARTMPTSAAALAIGAVSIVGIPPTAGFVCKWYIALGAFEAGRGAFGVVLVFGALFIFVYFVRMVNALYFRAPVRPEVEAAHEAPWTMRGPVLILAALCLAMGVLAGLPIGVVEPAILDLLGLGGP
jgi:multicomponent Na+:H+ antiporter subunit D